MALSEALLPLEALALLPPEALALLPPEAWLPPGRLPPGAGSAFLLFEGGMAGTHRAGGALGFDAKFAMHKQGNLNWC